MQVYSGDATTFEQEVHRFQVTDFSILELDLKQGGHVYGTIVLHLLGLCTSIQRLKVTLDDYEVIISFFGYDPSEKKSMSKILEIVPSVQRIDDTLLIIILLI